jgi:hypothetical protein
VTFGPEHEQPQARGDDESDSVTVAFGDREAQTYGLARVALGGGEASGTGILFEGTEPVAVRTEGVAVEIVEPLRRWKATFAGAFDLDVEALSEPLDASVGGSSGYEQVCRVRGTVGERRIDCLGQRGHAWGRLDLSTLELARTVSAWLDDTTALTVSAVRPTSAKHHADEEIAAHVVLDGRALTVRDPRLSTMYDADGRQIHAGLELWVGDEDGEYPHRAAGEVLCGTTLDMGRLRVDCAFFEWRMDGRAGVGRYDIVRRATG